jgi:lauroyl/myristoyl acyltransferase
LLDAVAELPAGPVTLARLCGTPLVPFSVLRDAPRRWRVEI